MQSISLSHSYSAMSSLCYLSYQSSWLKIFCTRKNIFEFTQVVTFSQKSVLILNQISTLQPQLLYRTVAIINTLLSCRSHVAIIYNMCLTDTFVVLFFFPCTEISACFIHICIFSNISDALFFPGFEIVQSLFCPNLLLKPLVEKFANEQNQSNQFFTSQELVKSWSVVMIS